MGSPRNPLERVRFEMTNGIRRPHLRLGVFEHSPSNLKSEQPMKPKKRKRLDPKQPTLPNPTRCDPAQP